ncbi:hypothetical protein PsorP6_008814 [Peronosclerospora sorghi]|uniref:Uncharacterized protein n=1 Tax=Peronosclerospora sorghi TaxID=230839 RepID=A0ACC0VX64_9STRA|nr:hypothetical protein PsorP6_008814 [Peronosclerospora sorghi]
MVNRLLEVFVEGADAVDVSDARWSGQRLATVLSLLSGLSQSSNSAIFSDGSLRIASFRRTIRTAFAKLLPPPLPAQRQV